MIPEKLTLTGSLGILAGLGREELTIDLSQIIPADAVTVAIKGDNGQGKSTLMNLALTPWREPQILPAGLYTEFGDSGLRELEFSHAGSRYRSRIEIKQTAKTKSQRAYLHVHTGDGGWQPVTLPDNTVSDGKTRTYDACLEYVLGPQSLYYLSAFRGQNAPKLAEYSDPKGLMRDLLALDEPALYREQARTVARELKREYEQVRSVYERATEQESRLADLTLRISTMETDIPRLTRAKMAASETVALARADFEQATTADAENVKIRRHREEMQQRIDAARSDGAKRVQQARADLESAERAAQQAVDAANRERVQIESDIRSAGHRMKSAQELIGMRQDVERAVAEVESLTGQIETQESGLAELRHLSQELERTKGDLKSIEQQLSANKRGGLALNDRRAEFERRSRFVDVVPCNGVAPYDACPALQEVHQARAQIDAITRQMDIKRGEWIALAAENKTIASSIKRMQEQTSGLHGREAAVSELRAQLALAQRIAAKLSGVQQAQAAYDQAQADVESLQSRMAQYRIDAEESAEKHAASVSEMTTRLAGVQSESERAIVDLQRHLDEMPMPDPAGALIAARRALESAEQALTDAASSADQAGADLAESRARAKSLRADIDAAASVRQHAKYLADEIAHWNLLAVGLQGVIDLSIEDAGPAIAAAANTLLTNAYGPRFSCQIVTQREQQNGRLVECFDISVIDSESGLESSILQKSGGESVWIDKALSDAVGIYHQDSAGVHYECLFADESEDGLTQERKLMFYRMDRAAMQLGGYKRKFFISHNPDAWSMADAVIDMVEFSGSR